MNDFDRGINLFKKIGNYLKAPASVFIIILMLIFGVTFFSCQIDKDDVVTYLWQRNYSLIDVQKPALCNWFYIPFVADSGNDGTVHIKGHMINAYGEIFIVNKTRSITKK